MKPHLIVVMGDVHHHIGPAAEGLTHLEETLGRPIDQVFSVGDLGLFLRESDWDFLTGPKKYRAPEASPEIQRAWSDWRWPLAMIGGNHEPFYQLRDWDGGYFSYKLTYTNAGDLPHQVPGLRVAGLSGIYHPQHEEFAPDLERRTLKLGEANSWPDMADLAQKKQISISRLTYYKESEVQLLKSFSPHLLLLHDWPVAPPHIRQITKRRPEAEIVAASQPPFVCCGHHHTSADFTIGPTRVLALNIISTKEGILTRRLNPGWCALFEWNGETLAFQQLWPE